MNENTGLIHTDARHKTDEQLAKEARDYLAQNPRLQVVSAFIEVVRRVELPELQAEKRRSFLSATERMSAYGDRPDLRQAVTTTLTGVPKNAARKMTPDFQASLVDQVVDAEDKTSKEFDEAFTPDNLAVYVDGALILNSYWEQFRWEDEDDQHREVVASFIESLLADREPFIQDEKPVELEPILYPWDVIDAIDVDVLLDRLPRDVQKALFKSWHAKEDEHSDEPWHALDYLEIATPRVLVKHIPLADLHGVVKLGMERMGFVRAEALSVNDLPAAEEPSPKA